MSDDAAELQKVRDRLLSLEYQDREIWRAHRKLAARHDELAKKVEGMSKADEIAAAVTTAIRSDRRARFTVPRRLAGAVAATVLLVPAVHELVVWLTAA